MDLKEPKPKPYAKSEENTGDLPLIRNEKTGELYRFKGFFNEFCVVIESEDDMKRLISMGCFGKSNLSRSFPLFQRNKPEILRDRVFRNRTKLAKNKKCPPEKVIVVPDSDSDDSDYFTNLQPKYELDYTGIREYVHLGLEEAYYLAAAINCLDIFYEDKLQTLDELWNMFKNSDEHFMQKYATYYYFRTKNWVVKPGIKFGGDFLLYKAGPHFYHASYIVIINIVDEDLNRIDDLNWRSMDLTSLIGLQRLCETVAKELLICDIIWPRKRNEKIFNDFTNLTIKETVMQRWTVTNRPSDASTTSNNANSS